MEIQPLGNRNLLIFLDSGELETLPCDIKTDDAADILKAALGGCRPEAWENVYLELYAGKNSLLLFARVHSGNPYFFMFEDIERLISASEHCPEDVISYLLFCGGKYFLIVYPWDKEPPPGALYEFGNHIMPHPYYALYLTEHGKTLLGPAALDELKKVF